MPIAIKAENISKAYQLGEIGTGTLSRDLERWFYRIRGKEDPFLRIGETNDRTKKGSSDIVWSLKDINFEIEQGDAVGIIGRNGAGKSTLLKVLSRVTSPTTGTIKGKGRIASLLEVGTGFHPELTGRENIYLNGAILGMRKKEITRKFDEIVDFAGVERYIDTPVKRYSSGMYVRLAFAVAAHLESEILIVDEVLAVGDAEFQKKCLGKMGEVSKGEGRTVLFVSHNMGSIQALCDKGLLLTRGEFEYYGEVKECIYKYLNTSRGGNIKNLAVIKSKELTVNEIEINDSVNSYVNLKQSQNNLKIKIKGHLKTSKQFSVEARFFDSLGIPVAFFSPGHYNGNSKMYAKGDLEVIENIVLPKNLNKGNLYLSLALTFPGIETYLEINQIVIDIEGYKMKSGWSFDSTQNGLLFLH